MKVLILGDGLLGKEIIKQTNWQYLSRKKDNFNIYDIETSLNEISDIDVIVNCIANTNTYSEDKKSHWDTNFMFVSNLIKYCNNKKIKLVHISTDYIYSDSIENATEEDIPVHCKNWYGYTKLLSDGLVQLESKNFLLIRCGHKPNPFPYDKAWIDQIGNFDYVDIISGLIIQAIKSNLSGVYNLGTELKSIYELATETKNVEKILSPNAVPKNISMNINKLKIDLGG